jgi:hypothetical protein
VGFSFSPLNVNNLSDKMGIDFAHSTSKERTVNMLLSGYVITFIIGIVVGIVFSTVILFGNRLKQLGEESSEK